MNKEFCTYEQARALKELGFDEPCIAYYNKKELFSFTQICNEPFKRHYIKMSNRLCTPTFSQAFRWMREKHLTYGIIIPTNVSKIQGIDCILEIHPPPDKHGIVYILEDGKLYTSYEEAEQACLDKIIQIVKNNAHI